MNRRLLYFDEGPGSSFPLCRLGHGKFGCVLLVENPQTGLLARKEPFQLFLGRTLTKRLSHIKLIRPAPIADWDCTFAYHVQHIHGVVRLRGCARHIKDDGFHAHVTYFEYCNLGSLESFHRNYIQRTNHAIPEYWVAKMLISMVDTITAVHRAGIVHRDTPARNWLLNWTSPRDVQIKLADFGEAMHKSQDPIQYLGWLNSRRKDHIGIWSSIRSLTTSEDGQDMPEYSQKFVAIVVALYWLTERIYRQEFSDEDAFDTAFQKWLTDLKTHFATLRPVDWPFGAPVSAARTFSVDTRQNPNIEEQFAAEAQTHHYSTAMVDAGGKIISVAEHDNADCKSILTKYWSYEQMRQYVKEQADARVQMVIAAARARKAVRDTVEEQADARVEATVASASARKPAEGQKIRLKLNLQPRVTQDQ